ncbi:unnamed protein product [Brassicogethes aeneus]|uniref:ABC transporter domain-containing protein n=1 Tax=Brassicogethes aeneus TaxID=1431903 RepID=A0A9P0BAB9_BRAAE|nr:unnamed protein product [Brassicogethes aeneus]
MSDSNDIRAQADALCDMPLKKLNRIIKRQPIDLEFQDLVYSVRDNNAKGGWRQLLKGINGKFHSGELTAILGPSGAGKTTLLNILAGYVNVGVKGSIKINSKARNLKTFNKISSYIMQEDVVQPRLTVREALLVAAKLKLGSVVSAADKIGVIDEVINLLGLQKCSDTMSEYLSGGQRKRLVVALELVNNPPIIFLDEPTSGLDNYAIKQCVDLLQKITKMGRTVICTIHQPPASLFQTFDQVYVIASGFCVYSGSPSNLVPFLDNSGYKCPPTYTPADYVIELVHSNPQTITGLSSNIQNGRGDVITKQKYLAEPEDFTEVYKDTTVQNVVFPTTFWQQFSILLGRMLLQMSRNKSMLYIQFFHHLLSGLLLGGIYFGVGNDASQTIAIFKYCICVNVFFMYTHVMAPVLLFPLEVKLLRREYFNRWYSLKPYYLALTVASLPIMLLLGCMFLTIVYFISYQPFEGVRFFWFCAMGLSVAVCSQGLGYAIGSMFSITNGSIVGPSTLAPLLALAVYGMGYKSSIEPLMKALMSLSYLRYGMVGFCEAIFRDREPLDCAEDEVYCHYRIPEILMVDMGMANQNFHAQLLVILGFALFFRVFAYVALKYRLTSELSSKIMHVAYKVFRKE